MARAKAGYRSQYAEMKAVYGDSDFGKRLGGIAGQLRSAGDRIPVDGDAEDVRLLLELRKELDEAIGTAVRGLHERREVSWATLGKALGRNRISVRERWGIVPGGSDRPTAATE